ncbi:hypothetical protein CRENBAI_005999 [Crenichthys baileyi]|uniref:Uncharacterized protein n=1 Tax=Crenichthys baileyi TaxID=28760 RepID=A0AAV9R4I8_9TELE
MCSVSVLTLVIKNRQRKHIPGTQPYAEEKRYLTCPPSNEPLSPGKHRRSIRELTSLPKLPSPSATVSLHRIITLNTLWNCAHRSVFPSSEDVPPEPPCIPRACHISSK